MSAQIQFEDAERPGVVIVVDADPQTAVQAGERADTTILSLPDGTRKVVIGDYREVKIKLQAAAAEGHGAGTAPQPNTAMS